MINKLFNDVLHVFFPDRCLQCGYELIETEAFLCVFCHEGHQRVYCSPFTLTILGATNCFCLYHFQEKTPTQILIHHLKYASKKGIGVELGKALARTVPPEHLPQLLFPVPLTSKKKLLRGYNQSEWIGRGFEQHTGIKLCSNTLIRIKHASSQTKLKKEDRLKNVAGAFALGKTLPQEITHVGILDDVITTGATLYQVVSLIKKHSPEVHITIFAAAIANR